MLASCATEEDEPYPLSRGWVGARVMQTEGALTPPLRAEDDCRSLGIAGSYVLVGFWWRGNLRRRIALLPQGSQAARVGDVVYVNLNNCTLPAQRVGGLDGK